jgi:predicted Zn-dependent peptidase
MSGRLGSESARGERMKNQTEDLVLKFTSAGVPVIVDRLDYARSAAFSVSMRVGSRDEPKGQNGIAHLLEHLIFKGTETMTAKEVNRKVEAAGGELNGYTTKEVTAFYVATLAETRATAQDILADIVSRPLLEAKDVAMERNVAIQEIRMARDDPESYSHELLAKAMWGTNPMGNPEAGEVDQVSALTESDVRGFFDSYYRPPNVAVVATGNIEAADVIDWAGAAFDPLPKARKAAQRDPPVAKAGVRIFPRKGDQAYVGVGFPAVSAGHPDRYVHGLVSGVLGAGTSSRLYQKVREEHGLVYSIYSMATPYTDTGAMSLFFSTSSKNAEQVMTLIAEELRRLKETGLEGGELDRARHWLKGMIVRRLEPVENRMFFLGETYQQTGKPMTSAQMLAKLESVTEEQAERVIGQVFDASKMCVALHCADKDGKKISGTISGLDF